MSDTMRIWVEVGFNVSYLIVVWIFVIALWRRQHMVLVQHRRLNQLFTWMFALLAIGDTGHVGFRVLAYALGGLESSISLFKVDVGLVGLGALATALTVTLFYALFVLVWAKRFGKTLGPWQYALLGMGMVRLIVMAFPQNQWSSTTPPWPWSLYRNLPLMAQGLGVAYLILRDAREMKDRTFWLIGICILVSYAFYLPVILWVRQTPILGMLMIPKTLAYVAIAWIAYRRLN